MGNSTASLGAQKQCHWPFQSYYYSPKSKTPFWGLQVHSRILTSWKSLIRRAEVRHLSERWYSQTVSKCVCLPALRSCSTPLSIRQEPLESWWDYHDWNHSARGNPDCIWLHRIKGDKDTFHGFEFGRLTFLSQDNLKREINCAQLWEETLCNRGSRLSPPGIWRDKPHAWKLGHSTGNALRSHF